MLRMARRRAGVSQRELARLSGVPQPTISRIERGGMSPTLDTLEPLVRACGMDIEAVEHPGQGCDRTLVAEMLRRTAAARFDAAVGSAINVQVLRRAAVGYEGPEVG